MKIALPSVKGQVDGHFGHCQFFTIFDIDDDKNIVSEEKLVPPPGCGCKSNIVPQLAEKGVTVMLAGNMGQGAVNKLNMSGIKVIQGCAGELKEVTKAWLDGSVKDSGQGCSDHGHGDCDHH
jgi:predicted Fe-Mo cluster-binding NifX family protein